MKKSSRLSVALHALVHLDQGAGPLTSADLATCLQTNPVVVRRVLGALREAGLVGAARGQNGGWTLARPAAAITVLEVYRALGEALLVRAEADAGDVACAIVNTVNAVMTDVIADAEALLAARLGRMSLADLAAPGARPLTHCPVHAKEA